MSDHTIMLDNITFSYSDRTDNIAESSYVFKNFNIEFPSDKVSVILGPSGCGKTTLLNIIGGLLSPLEGKVSFNNTTQTSDNFSILFQEPRLLPWRTIRKNVEIVLKSKFDKQLRRETAEHYLSLVGLKDSMNLYPSELSGGMRQRVAIARAFAYPADTILMDEPFQALDIKLKQELRALFTKLWVEDKRTAILVTHDINEAVMLGDEIFVFAGERPVKIAGKFVNDEPHMNRNSESKKSNIIQKKLYSLLA
ncbi:MAG: ATP-binding cassette domain-containing protein [Spirochaetales bacterium]|nr:ATP-binding cassette domain-containing protein [Spirochaetales bacterium]